MPAIGVCKAQSDSQAAAPATPLWFDGPGKHWLAFATTPPSAGHWVAINASCWATAISIAQNGWAPALAGKFTNHRL